MKLTNIPPTVLKFIKDVQKNNNRPWFNENKSRYQDALENMKTFTENVVNQMNKIDEIEDHKVYRIYRDNPIFKRQNTLQKLYGRQPEKSHQTTTRWLLFSY